MEQNTGQMRNAAIDFNKDSTQIKDIVWWRNTKLLVAVIVAFVLLIAVIALIIIFTTK